MSAYIVYLKNNCEQELLGSADGLLGALDQAASYAHEAPVTLQRIQGMKEIAQALRDGIAALPAEISQSEEFIEAYREMYGAEPDAEITVGPQGVMVAPYKAPDMGLPSSMAAKSNIIAPFMKNGKMVPGGTQ